MANSISHAALPYPIKGARYTMAVPFLDADGDPTDPTTPDTEVSLDGAAFADAAEEVTTVSGSNGQGYLTFSGAETNVSTLQVAFKVASGPKATLATLYPRVLASVGTGTLSAGSAGGGTLGTLLPYDVTGCFIKTTGGTGGGGTGGANNQVRKIITYNTTTGAFTVAPNWETTPDNTTTYDVLLPEGVTLGMLRALNPATPGRTLVVDSAGLADATVVKLGPSGSATAQTARDIGASVLVGDKTGFSLSSAGVQAIWDALTSALTTVGSIGKMLVDRIDAAITSRASPAEVNAEADTALADAGVTATRTGYLDNLNVGGAVASSAEVTAIQNNTRVVRVVPSVIERPDSGTETYRIELLLYDATGNMEAPDSAPTLDLVNAAGTDLSARLDSATGTLVSTGRYRWVYTADAAHDLEQLVFTFSVVEGGATRLFGNTTLLVDTTAVDFTSADRAKLDTLHDTRIPGVVQPQSGDAYARLGAPAGASVSADIAAVKGETATILSAVNAVKAVTDLLPDAGALNDLAAVLATVDSVTHGNAALKALIDTLDTVADAVKAKTDNLPASPAAVGSAMTLTSGERDAIATALLDLADSIETGATVRLALRYIAASCTGLTSNDGKTFKGVGVATTRITATMSGKDRTAVVLS